MFVCLFVCLMVFNATFNNISFISWRPVLLVEETKKTIDLSQVTDKLYHMVIGSDCIGSCKSNYHAVAVTITTAAFPTLRSILD